MTDGSASTESETLFAELLAAAASLRDMPDVARAEAWGSSVLSIWREDPEAAAFDADFLAWLRDSDHEDAALVLLATASATDATPGEIAVARESAPPGVDWVIAIKTARATRAWEVDERDGRSVGIGFVHGDQSELSLLADIIDDRLVELIVAPGPDDLFDEAEDLVAPQDLSVGDAATEIVSAWRACLAAGIPLSESMFVNQLLARDRLRAVLDEPLDDLLAVPAPPATMDTVDPADRAELDAWALSVLRGALGEESQSGQFEDGLLDPLVPERQSEYPREEAEAFSALEWADWLGAVLGALRNGPGSDVSPRTLVDHINRCPEITSTIPKKDRPYYEWAWQHVLVNWQRHGVADSDRRLTEAGVGALPAALMAAWGRPPVSSPRTPG